MSTPLWKVYLTRAALPIGLAVAFVFVAGTFVNAVRLTPNEKEFGVECALIDGVEESINGSTFCVRDVKIDLGERRTLAEMCNDAGGKIRNGPYDDAANKRIRECRKSVVVEELGARHEYTATR